MRQRTRTAFWSYAPVGFLRNGASVWGALNFVSSECTKRLHVQGKICSRFCSRCNIGGLSDELVYIHERSKALRRFSEYRYQKYYQNLTRAQSTLSIKKSCIVAILPNYQRIRCCFFVICKECTKENQYQLTFSCFLAEYKATVCIIKPSATHRGGILIHERRNL